MDVLYNAQIPKSIRQRFLENVVSALQVSAGLVSPLRNLLSDLNSWGISTHMEGHRILAVFEKDLDPVIECFGLAEPLEQGEIHCCICGQLITRENLGVFCVLGKGKIRTCCSKLDCHNKEMEDLRQEDL